jgi:hypothetical protein
VPNRNFQLEEEDYYYYDSEDDDDSFFLGRLFYDEDDEELAPIINMYGVDFRRMISQIHSQMLHIHHHTHFHHHHHRRPAFTNTASNPVVISDDEEEIAASAATQTSIDNNYRTRQQTSRIIQELLDSDSDSDDDEEEDVYETYRRPGYDMLDRQPLLPPSHVAGRYIPQLHLPSSSDLFDSLQRHHQHHHNALLAHAEAFSNDHGAHRHHIQHLPSFTSFVQPVLPHTSMAFVPPPLQYLNFPPVQQPTFIEQRQRDITRNSSQDRTYSRRYNDHR